MGTARCAPTILVADAEYLAIRYGASNEMQKAEFVVAGL